MKASTLLQRDKGDQAANDRPWVNIDIPHAGRYYPSEFHPICPQLSLIKMEDRFADVFYAPLKRLANRWLQAVFARSYVDVNRPRSPQSGVIRQFALDGNLIQTPLTLQDFEARMSAGYDPYYEALADDLQTGLAMSSGLTHLSLHSYPTVDRHWPGQQVMPFEIEIGDLDGRSSPRSIGAKLATALEAEGFVVGYNETFRGGEVVRFLANLAGENADMVQIEVRRDLYLTEEVDLAIDRLQMNQVRFMRSLKTVICETTIGLWESPI
jgi:N-formylglutamate deformylase